MNVANESPSAPSLRRLPFSIRFAPEFTNCLSAILPAYGDELDRFDGLLFGIVESDFTVLRVFRLFPSTLDTETQESFQSLLTQSRKEPQVAGLALVGWFSARSEVHLQPEDIAFHEKNFLQPNHIALMVKSEPASQMSLEVYCRTSDGVFSEQKHRCAGIRMSNASPILSPFELPLETKVYSEFLFTDVKPVKPEKAGESAMSNPASEDLEFLELDDPSSITPLQLGTSFGVYGGAAAAPARIPQEEPEIRRAVEQRTQAKPPDEDGPRIVNVPKQTLPAPPLREAVLVRSEEPRNAPQSANERLAQALHWSHSEQSRTDAGHHAPAAPASIPAASLGQLAQARSKTLRDLPWRGMAALFAVAASGTFGFIYLKTAHANGRMPGFLQALLPPPTLDMKVATVGDRFQLSWNRATPAVRNAREAILDISDGRQHHQIQLDNAEVANGSILYLPNTDDVVFRLEVHGTGGQNARESVRVLGSSKSAALQVSEVPDKPASGMPAYPAQAAAKKATGSRRMSSTPAPAKPRHEDVVAANRVASGVGKSVPVSPPPPASAPPVSAPPAARTETSDKAVALPDSTAANPTAMNTVAANANPTVPPFRDSADPPPPNTGAATPPTEQPRAPETSTPQASGVVVPAGTGSANNAPAQIPQPAEAQQQQGAPTDAKPLVSYRPPRPVRQVLPKLSALPAGIAADAGGEVRIVVRVDQSGRVVDARLVEGKKKISPILANAALVAARQWVFEPASLHGASISSDHTILFQFRH